jgi:hypothetical protein
MRIFAVIGFPHIARRVHAIPEVEAPPAPPAVRDLTDDRYIVLMHRVAEFLEVRNHAIFEELDATPISRCARRMNTRRSKAHHESDPAARFLFVIAALDILRHAIDREGIGVRAAANPILDGVIPNLNRRKEMLKFGHGPSVVNSALVFRR